MYKFTVPNYKENNIVNLMSSISNTFGKKHTYQELISLSSEELNNFQNIVLIVIDGLGYNYLKNQKESFLFKHLHSKLTSTFLSTTACANTVFHVGYPPQQHALTGWTINLKEVGEVTKVLPFTPESGVKTLSKKVFDINKIMDISSLHKDFKGECFTIIDKEKSKRDFIKYTAKNTTVIPTQTYADTFSEVEQLINKESKERRFIHAYMDEFDAIQHYHGTDAEKTNALFVDIDKKIKKLSESIKNTHTKIIVVADHGLINISKESEIWVKDIPGLEECLTAPITGEPRVRDCFVKTSKVKDFEEIIESNMSQYCWCFKGMQLIEDNFYGLGTPNKKLFDRVGHYVLIMKDNYVLRDKHEKHEQYGKTEKASHGAFSDDEMLVPLITIDC